MAKILISAQIDLDPAQREEALRLKALREAVSLMRRDLAALAAYGARCHPGRADWTGMASAAEDAAGDLRRRLGLATLAAMRVRLEDAPRDTPRPTTSSRR